MSTLCNAALFKDIWISYKSVCPCSIAQCQDPGSRKDVLLLHSAWDNFSIIRFINHLKYSIVLEQLNCFRLQTPVWSHHVCFYTRCIGYRPSLSTKKDGLINLILTNVASQYCDVTVFPYLTWCYSCCTVWRITAWLFSRLEKHITLSCYSTNRALFHWRSSPSSTYWQIIIPLCHQEGPGGQSLS